MNEFPSLEQIEEIFHAALELTDCTARQHFVERACAGDFLLRERVGRLLQAHVAAADDWLFGKNPNEILLPTALSTDFAFLRDEQAGGRIGPYTLLEKLGEGGFGTVWMAEQEGPLRRRVALKIPKLGMDTREVIARFDQERQALARMDHPNIAKVFDAGATATGRPFFVMELVQGTRITDFCDAAEMAPAERLHLFMQVCHAVQHAHQKGIIHRDLKPSNILVALHDGVAVPKVIDFGVAKAIEQKLTDFTLLTQQEQMIGTPLYISPEQAAVGAGDVDTRSDIYSLGVLLYELLTGRLPFDPGTLLQRGLEEIRRVIREEDPPRPSTALSSLAKDALTRCAQCRASEPPKLLSLLRGDLDWIVMRALEKDRTRRYETASAFAEDLQRHLACKPVHARPPSTMYRFQRLVRRNRVGFAAATVAVVALITGITLSVWQAIRANAALSELRLTLGELRATAPAFAEQARVLAEAEDFDGAIEKLNYAISLQPEEPHYRIAKGDLLQCQLRMREAGEAYREALRIHPFLPAARERVSLCEKLAEAESGAEGWTEEQPGVAFRSRLRELLEAMRAQQRPAAQLMQVAQRLGAESEILLRYWQTRLKDVPLSADRPLGERLSLRKDGLLALDLNGSLITDFSSLKGMPLGELECEGCPVADLAPLRGMPLRRLNLRGTKIYKVAPLASCSKMEELNLAETRVINLDPLRGLPLKKLWLDKLEIDDLSPLQGMPLEVLAISHTRVMDLAPLRGMPLRRIEMDAVPAVDFSPLSGSPLETLTMRGTRVYNQTFLRSLPLKELFFTNAWMAPDQVSTLRKLEVLALPSTFEIWSKDETENLKGLRTLPNLRRLGIESALGTVPLAEEFLSEWDQHGRIVDGFAAAGCQASLRVLSDRTWEVNISGEVEADLTPLRGTPVSRLIVKARKTRDIQSITGLPLRALSIEGTQVPDLRPIAGMALEEVDVSGTQVSDLSPLRGMPLRRLNIERLQVSDISPLRGMSLEQLWMGTTEVSDLSPLRGMPIRLLMIDGCPHLTDLSPLLDVPLLEQLTLPRTGQNVQVLRALPNLKFISYEVDGGVSRPLHTASEFWSVQNPDSEGRMARRRRWADISGLARARVRSRRSTDESKDYLRLALLELMTGQVTNYESACGEMWDRLRGAWPEYTVVAFSLNPELANQQRTEIRRLVNAVIQFSDVNTASSMATLACGIGEYRLGEWDAAERWLVRSEEYPGTDAPKRAAALAVHAMAHHQRKSAAAARDCLQKARGFLDGFFGATHHYPATSYSWQEWVLAQLLFDEATKLTGGESAASGGH